MTTRPGQDRARRELGGIALNVLIPVWFPLDVQGGCQSHVADLVSGLKDRGHAPRLVPPQREGLITTLLRLALAPLYVIDREAYRACYTRIIRARWAARIRHLVRSEHVDVVHCHDVILGSLFARWHPRPVVLTVHGYAAFEAMSVGVAKPGRAYYETLSRFERDAYSAADRIIAVDSRIRKYLIGLGVPTDKITGIPNAVDHSAFSPAPCADGPHEAPTTPVILCPRRLVPKNGPEIALRAFAELYQRGIAAALQFAGDGPMRDELESSARKLGLGGKVSFLGSVEHGSMPALYRAATVVVIPSVSVDGIEEATSIAAIEAMACGKPVIATDIGGLREIIIDGENGLLIPSGDAHSLAQRIALLIEEPSIAERLAEHAVDHVAGNHALAGWIRRITTVYERATA